MKKYTKIVPILFILIGILFAFNFDKTHTKADLGQKNGLLASYKSVGVKDTYYIETEEYTLDFTKIGDNDNSYYALTLFTSNVDDSQIDNIVIPDVLYVEHDILGEFEVVIKGIHNNVFKDVNVKNFEFQQFGDGIQLIGASAFENCSNLESFDLPSSVTSIGNNAFKGCAKLNSITLGDNITSIGNNVFEDGTLVICSESKFDTYEGMGIKVTYEVEVTFKYVHDNVEVEQKEDRLYNQSILLHKTKEGFWLKDADFLNSFNITTDYYFFQHFVEGEVKNDESNVEITEDYVVTTELLFTANYAGYYNVEYDADYNGYIIVGFSTAFLNHFSDEINHLPEAMQLPYRYFYYNDVAPVSLFEDHGQQDVVGVDLSHMQAGVAENVNVNFIYLTENFHTAIGIESLDSNRMFIAPDKATYDAIKANNGTNENTNLTYEVKVTVDFNNGTVRNFTKLANHTFEYTKSNDLTWKMDSNSKLETPIKENHVFLNYTVNNNVFDIDTQEFTEDCVLVAQYNQIKVENSNTDVDASIESDKGFTPGSTFTITKLPVDSHVKYDELKTLDTITILSAYNAVLNTPSVLITRNGDIYTIRLFIGEYNAKDNFYMYQINNDGVLVSIDAEYEKGYVSFETTTLGEFAIASKPAFNLLTYLGIETFGAILLVVLFVINIVELFFIFALNKKKNIKQRDARLNSTILPLIVALTIGQGIIIGLAALAVIQLGIIGVILLATSRIGKPAKVKPVKEVKVKEVKEEIQEVVEETPEVVEETVEETVETVEENVIEESDDNELSDLVLVEDTPENTRAFLDVNSLDDSDEGEDATDDETDEEELDYILETDLPTTARINKDTGRMILVRYKKSFTARLNLTSDLNKDYHNAIKNKLLSYKKIKARVSWNYEAYNFGRLQAAKLNVRGKTVFLYLPLDPAEYVDSKYSFKDCSEIKKYQQLPLRLKIKSNRGLKHAFELIEVVMNNFETDLVKNFEPTNYYRPNIGFERLLEQGFIKEVLDYETYKDLTEINKEFLQSTNIKSIDLETIKDFVISEEVYNEVLVSIKPAPVGKGKKDIINVDTISKAYKDGEVVSLDSLKEKKLIKKSVSSVKCLARGTLDKRLTFELQSYSNDAIKMILVTGGKIQ